MRTDEFDKKLDAVLADAGDALANEFENTGDETGAPPEWVKVTEDLKRSARIIESALDSVLPSGDVPHGVLYEAMRYSAQNGGKRIRPYLTLEFCRALGGDVKSALPYACAVECIHTYSLIHDDLPALDNDDMRRGKPSLHCAYGEANAILAGDALLTYAFALAAENPFADAVRNASAVSALANHAGFDGMIGGQVCDLLYTGKKITLDELFETERKKTGDLICAACTLGIIAADAEGNIPENVYSAARRYAYSLGLAFQIVDDILDADSADGEMSDGETSVVSIIGTEEAASLAAKLTEEAVFAASELPNGGGLAALALYLRDRRA